MEVDDDWDVVEDVGAVVEVVEPELVVLEPKVVVVDGGFVGVLLQSTFCGQSQSERAGLNMRPDAQFLIKVEPAKH